MNLYETLRHKQAERRRTRFPGVRARQAGLTKYDGKPCRHGHGTLRYVCNHLCVICACNYALAQKRRHG